MKTKLLSGFSLLLLVFTTSCNFTENITVNPDGSGSMSIDMDASQLMAVAGKELAKDGDKRIDSTMSFKALLATKKDSIAKLPKEEQEKLKKLENFSMKMLMDPATSEFKFTLMSDFKKVSEMGDAMEAFDKAGPMANKKRSEAQPDLGLDKYKTKVNYTYDGLTFTKKIARKEKMPETQNDSVDMFAAMLDGSTYTLNYKFSKKVKSVSEKKAVISSDRKTVTVVYPFSDYLVKPEEMSIEVQFEK